MVTMGRFVVLKAYNPKNQKKAVPIQDPVITKTGKGLYRVTGHDGNGTILISIVSERKAYAAIEQGMAKKGW